MLRPLFAVLFLGVFSLVAAQPQAPVLPGKGQAVAELPSNVRMLTSYINSSSDEIAPQISADGKVLYFTRKQHPQNFGVNKAGDIWVSKRKPGGGWSRPVNAGAPLNNIYENEAVALEPGGQVIYLNNSYLGDGEGMAVSRRDGRSWTSPRACNIEDFYTRGDGATFHLGSGGITLIMALERENGLGQRDLYVSFRQAADQWSIPVNLGAAINTPGDEARAYLAADGRSLYFASRGHGGRGGLDLFYSYRLDDSWTNWTPAQNLGDGINTPFDDEYISIPASGNPAFLVYRDSSSLNIYSTQLPEEFRPQAVTLVRARVNLEENESLDQLEVTSLDLQNTREPKRLPLDQSGSFAVVIPAGKELGVQVAMPGYFPASIYLRGQGPPEFQNTDDQGILPAAAEFSSQYLERDQEIQDLRMRLDILEEELGSYQQIRERYPRQLTGDYPYQAVAYTGPELDSLRSRFEALESLEVADTLSTIVQNNVDWQPKEVSKPDTEIQQEKSDAELAEMKKRFNRYYRAGPGEAEENQAIWEEANAFELFHEEVYRQMVREMKPVVGRILSRELWPEVRQSLQKKLDPESLRLVDDKEKEICEQISRSMEETNINLGDFFMEMPYSYLELEEQLRGLMDTRVRTGLENVLRDSISDALENEALYQACRYEAGQLELQLKINIELQVKEERRQLAGGIRMETTAQAVKSLEPAPSIYQEDIRELVLLSPAKGDVFLLNNVFFLPNTDLLKEISFLELDRVADFLVEHSNLKVEIAAHTNGWLSHSMALQLSQQRATAIANYLLIRGVAARQIQARGYGKTNPVASNDHPDGRLKNQRIEIHILEY